MTFRLQIEVEDIVELSEWLAENMSSQYHVDPCFWEHHPEAREIYFENVDDSVLSWRKWGGRMVSSAIPPETCPFR